MSTVQKRYIIDLLERVVWTLLQAASAEGVVALFDLDQSLVVPIAGGLALLKGLGAKYIGAKSTAATLSAAQDTPAPVPLAAPLTPDPDPIDKLLE